MLSALQPMRPAALLAAALVLALPAQAMAHSIGLGVGDRPIDERAAASHAAGETAALAGLPRETAQGTCLKTAPVEGLGDACRTDNGEFRVRLASGVTITTHGTDAPRDSESVAASLPHLPDSQDAIDDASVADVECTSAPGDRRVELVYVRPSDKPDRSATLAEPMRQALYQASAFVDAEAQALDAAQGRRFRVLCSGGVPVVHSAVVSASGAIGGDYSGIVDDLVAQGYPAPSWMTSSTRRFMIFYDDQSQDGAAGVGGIWYDEVPGVDNYNNLGARYAIEFDWGVSHLPHWDVFLHEMSHNMGAVQDSAPDASLAGHCIDGLDIMCYDDGGTGGTYTSTTCSVERYDCGADTYFNPSPTGGSYLATHWNVASTNNLWLVPRDLGWDDGGVPDLVPPTVPGAPSPSSITQASATVSWGASTDLRTAVVRYRVAIDRSVDGAWQLHANVQPVSGTSINVTQLASGATYRFRVSAYDQAGNYSAESMTTATMLSGPPIPPASAALTIVNATSVDAAWVAGTSALGVRGHELELQRGVNAWLQLGEVGGVTARISNLRSGEQYRLRVRTVAVGGTVSQWRTSATVTMPGELAGGDGPLTTPGVTIAATSPSRATVSWNSSPGASTWEVELVDPRGTRRTFNSSSTSLGISGLVPNSTYSVGVVAVSADGSRRSGTGTSSFRAPRDTRAPGASAFSPPRFAGTTMRITWTAASDDAGVARYELQRRKGARWMPVAVKPGTTNANVPGVRRGTAVTLRLRAIDVGGNAGRWATKTIRRR